MSMTRSIGPVPAALIVAASLWPLASGQRTRPQNPALIIRSMAGRDLFEFYCASCHGRDGRGAGPAASALKTPPPDLTTLAHRNGGTFPKQRVQEFVTFDGATVTLAHGSKDMPVWGPIFRGLDPSDISNRIRIVNIVEYIASLQAT